MESTAKCFVDFFCKVFRIPVVKFVQHNVYFRCVKFSMPNVPDFETLFTQTSEFILSCNGEHVRYATDSCKFK